MLSRVAQRLYWFARYMERAENTARLILIRHQLILDLPANIQPHWGLLINVMGANSEFEQLKRKPTEKSVIPFVFGNKDNPGSIMSSVANARENMRTTREVMPEETWERVNSLFLSMSKRSGKDLPRAQRHKILSNVIHSCQQISGLIDASMNHDESYQFIRLGRNIERADMTSRIVDTASISLVGEPEEIMPYRNVQWVSVLNSISAQQMYRLSVRRKVNPESVLDFLLKSSVFPRSVLFCVEQMGDCSAKLKNSKKTLALTKSTVKNLQGMNISDLEGDKLNVFIDEFQMRLSEINSAIKRTWFHPEEKS